MHSRQIKLYMYDEGLIPHPCPHNPPMVQVKMSQLTCSLTCYSGEHHVTRVNGVDEVWREGTPLANTLDGALVCLMHQDDSLQECLYMRLGLHSSTHSCQDFLRTQRTKHVQGVMTHEGMYYAITR